MRTVTDRTKENASSLLVNVRLERWTEIAGTRVAELSASGTNDATEHVGLGGEMGTDIAVNAKMRGAYAITASGRVLRAKVENVAQITMTTATSGKPSIQHHTQNSTYEMHLVGACDGPTEASLATPLSREERAIRAWGDAWLAANRDDKDRTLAIFEPALRKKLGDAKIWNALSSYRNLRGEHALPPPVLLRDTDVQADGVRVRLVSHGAVKDPTQSVNHPVDLVVTLDEASGIWRVHALRGDMMLDGKITNVLELSRDRLVVPQGWPPQQ
jgi:hypothetical protein